MTWQSHGNNMAPIHPEGQAHGAESSRRSGTWQRANETILLAPRASFFLRETASPHPATAHSGKFMGDAKAS